jgi:hypothetical protein
LGPRIFWDFSAKDFCNFPRFGTFFQVEWPKFRLHQLAEAGGIQPKKVSPRLRLTAVLNGCAVCSVFFGKETPLIPFGLINAAQAICGIIPPVVSSKLSNKLTAGQATASLPVRTPD